MAEKQTILKVKKFIQNKFSGEGTGHDWHHIFRVWKISKYIAKKEKAKNIFLVELIALLHDLEDWKFNPKASWEKLPQTRKLLKNLKIGRDLAEKIIQNINKISFKGTGRHIPPDLEGKIVQDADRLDALGAIGIARCFAYGGKLGRPIYDPKVSPLKWKKINGKVNLSGTSLNHFYEKLLLLKNRMNTNTGVHLAVRRHKFLESYLREFLAEWEGKIL